MKAIQALLVGGVVVSAGLLLVGMANAKPRGNPPPKPGPGATVDNLPANSGPGLPAIKRTMWRVNADGSGQQAGVMILLQSATNSNDWALIFKNDATQGAGVLAYSQTPIGGLIAQQLAAGVK
jgi:hypothetical protein